MLVLPNPAAWLTGHAHLLPRHGDAADVACGRGRHACWLASHSLTVTAIDRDREALDALRVHADAARLPITTLVCDLEADDVSLGVDAFDVIIGINYLHRPLFSVIIAALRPGGLLLYETFTRAQAALGKPTNPAFLLEPGELPTLVRPLTIVDAREGLFEGRHVASVAACKTLD